MARPRVLADLIPGELLRDALLVIGGAGFIGLLAQVSFALPGDPVPVTGQTLGVLLAGAALGSRRAPLASILYLLAGVVGVPWFAGHSAGWPGATAGYVVGFIFCSALCGWLAERGADRTVWRALATMVVGECVTFTFGLLWLALDLHLGAGRAIALGLSPFIAGEGVKLAAAAALLPASWRVLRRLEAR